MKRLVCFVALWLLAVQGTAAENMRTVSLGVQSVPRTFPAAGSLVAQRQMRLAVRIAGRVAELNPRPGDTVDEGALLARIDAPELDAQQRQLKAELRVALANEQDARADLARLKRLRASKVVSEDELRNAQLRLTRAKANVAAGRAGLSMIQVDLDEQVLRSPARLRVLRRLAEPGDVVAADTALLEVETLDAPRFETFVPLARMSVLQPGMPVDLTIGGDRWPGVIRHLLASADAVTRRGKVEIELKQWAGLMPGQYGVALLPMENRDLLLVPDVAVVQRAGISCVFVVGADARVRLRTVRLGRRIADGHVVLAGLHAGERIVLSPDTALRDGEPWPYSPAR